MIRKHFILAMVTLFALGCMTTASAGTIRCGVHLIQDGGRNGPGKYEVLKKCGEPAERFGNTWVYEMKGNRYVLTFKDNGQLARISRPS
jgi:hypothetical protein